MRLWMIVAPTALRALEAEGELVSDGRRVPRDLQLAYRWMAEQLTARIGPPPRPGALPLWAWAQWQGPKRRKPDMRCGGHWPRGAACFRLTLEVPTAQILLSDFADWHCVLNQCPLVASEDEWDAFERDFAEADAPWGGPYPEPIRSRVVASWSRIFDLDQLGAYPHFRGDPAGQSIQATFWRLDADQVRRVEQFWARG
jgi:Domain of unknown function (DUF3841)